MRFENANNPTAINSILNDLLAIQRKIGLGKGVIRKSRVMDILGNNEAIPNEVISFVPVEFYYPIEDDIIDHYLDVDLDWVIERLQVLKAEMGTCH